MMEQELHIFVSYSHKDEELHNQLMAHLRLLKRQDSIVVWHDRKILPDDKWGSKIDKHLKTSQIILLLISSDFIDSDYCSGVGLDEAMKRVQEGEARVIPIILRPTDWQDAPFGELQALPKDGKPITTWLNRDKAFLDVVQGIRKIVEDFVPNP